MTTNTPPEIPYQLPFDLPVRPARGRDAFFVSPANALAVAQVAGLGQVGNGGNEGHAVLEVLASVLVNVSLSESN